MKFTKEEISLCKQIAEKHRKRIVFGIWFHDLEDPEHLPFLWCNLTDELKRRSAVPLWTISDCLTRRKKGKALLNLPCVLNLSLRKAISASWQA